jgi:hypothetical protein
MLWLQPSVGSDTARRLSLKHGFKLVEDIDIAATAALEHD